MNEKVASLTRLSQYIQPPSKYSVLFGVCHGLYSSIEK